MKLYNEKLVVRMELIHFLFRWRSADGNDYLCGYCKSQNQLHGKSVVPGLLSPRGFGKVAAESMWRSGLKTNGKKEKMCICCMFMH